MASSAAAIICTPAYSSGMGDLDYGVRTCKRKFHLHIMRQIVRQSMHDDKL